MGVYVQTPGLYQHEFEWQDITFVNQMMMPSTQKTATGCPLTPKVVFFFVFKNMFYKGYQKMGLMKMFSIWLQKGLDPVTMSPPQAHSGGAGGDGPEE